MNVLLLQDVLALQRQPGAVVVLVLGAQAGVLLEVVLVGLAGEGLVQLRLARRHVAGHRAGQEGRGEVGRLYLTGGHVVTQA